MIFLMVIFIVIIATLKVGFDVKIPDLKNVKNIGNNDEMNSIVRKFPNSKNICENFLKILGNNNCKIEIEKEEKNQTCLYIALKNKILLGNLDNNPMRIQTIAHECVHASQNRRMLLFNFAISNFNIVYFIIIFALSIFKVVNMEMVYILITTGILLEFVHFAVLAFLEIDAMTRAEYETYLYVKNSNFIDENEENILLEFYKRSNKIGIKLYIFMLGIKAIIKPMLYYAVSLIFI